MKTISVFAFLQFRIKACKQNFSDSSKIKATFNRLTSFCKGKDITFKEFNAEFVDSFEKHLIADGLKLNTVGFYLRILRKEYNIAVKDGLTENNSPFIHAHIIKEPANKQSLTIEEIKAIKNCECCKKQHLEIARDMFMFAFYAQGMDFFDMAYLLRNEVVDNGISYKRRKSKQDIHVNIQPEMQAIINKYPNRTKYLLPIIDNKKTSIEKQLRNKKHAIGRNLRTVAQLAGVKTNVTFDIARVTWQELNKVIIETAHRQLLDQLN